LRALELFRDPEQRGLRRQSERLDYGHRGDWPERGDLDAKVGVAILVANEPFTGQHLFDAGADRPAGAGRAIGLQERYASGDVK
jgi:hypothetical protein